MTVPALAIRHPQSGIAFGAPFPDRERQVSMGLSDRGVEPPGPNESPDGEFDDAGKDERIADLGWNSICSKLLSVGQEAISDVDLLTLLLSHRDTEGDARALATQLIQRFETFGNVVNARDSQITGTAEMPSEMIDLLRLVRAAGTRLAREEISNRPVLDAWHKLLPYLRAAMAHQTEEQFRVLFLDRSNVLIADEVQHRGTIDHTPVYPREVAKRALELDASAIIMAHNHPSNNPEPSNGDIRMTRTIRDTLEPLGIVLHDHIIIARSGHRSFRDMGLLNAKLPARRRAA